MKNIIFFYFLVNLFVKQPNLKKKKLSFPPSLSCFKFHTLFRGKKIIFEIIFNFNTNNPCM